MEATFCLSRHLCTKPIFTTPCSRPTIVHFHVDLSYHNHCSLRGGTLKSWPTQKAHRKTLAVNSVPVPKDKNGGDGEGKPTQLVRTTVVLACALGAICMSGMVGPPAFASTHMRAHRHHEQPPSQGLLLDKSLKAFLKAQKAELLKADQAQGLVKLIQNDGTDPYNLQEVVQKLRMTDKAQTVVEELQKKYDNSGKDKRGDDAHSLGLILVEMLIYQGEYKKAIRLLEEDQVGDPSADKGGPNSNNIPGSLFSDARRELFLAAAYLMLGESEAQKNWGNLRKKVEDMPEKPTYHINSSFDKFKSRIQGLKKNIDAYKRVLADAKKAK